VYRGETRQTFFGFFRHTEKAVILERATPARRQQHAVVAEIVGGLRDLPKIFEINSARAD
jgi:hypothetical protein